MLIGKKMYMKTILVVGCNGQIGQTLIENLNDKYKIIGCDIVVIENCSFEYYMCDASQYEQLEIIFNKNKIDTVINLAGMREVSNIPSLEDYYKMVDCYLNSTYLLLTLMQKYNVKKMILASTNHVTDYYEDNGYSILGREISTKDYPISKGVYGTLKLAAENVCRVFNINYNIKTVVFRIGTYRKHYVDKQVNNRWNRTILKTEDLLRYFEKAIEKDCDFEIYYLVSDNINKPWDTNNLKEL